MLSRFSRVRLFVTPWTVAHQGPLSMGSSSQEYWNGLPCTLPEDLPYPGIEPGAPILQADSLPSEPPGKLHLLRSPLILLEAFLEPNSPQIRVQLRKQKLLESFWVGRDFI